MEIGEEAKWEWLLLFCSLPHQHQGTKKERAEKEEEKEAVNLIKVFFMNFSRSSQKLSLGFAPHNSSSHFFVLHSSLATMRINAKYATFIAHLSIVMLLIKKATGKEENTHEIILSSNANEIKSYQFQNALHSANAEKLSGNNRTIEVRISHPTVSEDDRIDLP